MELLALTTTTLQEHYHMSAGQTVVSTGKEIERLFRLAAGVHDAYVVAKLAIQLKLESAGS